MKTRLPVIIFVQLIFALSPLLVIGATPSPAPVKKTEKAPITLESASAMADKKAYYDWASRI